MASEQWIKFYTANNQNAGVSKTGPQAFFGRKASAATIQERRVTGRYEGRKNQCGECFTAKPCGCE